MQEVVLITGCSTGIGKAMCRIMKKQGCVIAATARNVSSLLDLEADLKLALDVTDGDSIRAAVGKTLNRFGKIDILVNNAGYSVRGALEELPVTDAKKIFDVNVFGIMRMIQASAPGMREKGRGKIVNIGSVSGRYTQAANGSYCASKHAVEALTEAARLELSPFGIQVCVIEPGPMETEFFRTLDKNSNDLMQNPSSPYRALYSSDRKKRSRQKRMTAEKAAGQITRIILGKSCGQDT